MKQLLNTILTLLLATSLRAQEARQQALEALRGLGEKYRTASMLSFDVRFTYADPDAPEVILDSMSGNIRTMGNRFACTVDHVHTISDGERLVAIYGEDSLIYLARPSENTVAANPVAVMDSALAAHDADYQYVRSGKSVLITISFNRHPAYRELLYEIDRKSGYLVRSRQTVHASLLYGADAAVPGEGSRYSIVETVFDNYKREPGNASFFSLEKYVKKEGSGYVAQAPYENYRVFLGNTNL